MRFKLFCLFLALSCVGFAGCPIRLLPHQRSILSKDSIGAKPANLASTPGYYVKGPVGSSTSGYLGEVSLTLDLAGFEDATQVAAGSNSPGGITIVLPDWIVFLVGALGIQISGGTEQGLFGHIESILPDGTVETTELIGTPRENGFAISGRSFNFDIGGGYTCQPLACLFQLDRHPPGNIPVSSKLTFRVMVVRNQMLAGTGPLLGVENFAINAPTELVFRSDPVLEIDQNLLFLVNTKVLPHIPLGVLNNLNVGTDIVVTNPHPIGVNGQLNFFDAADGDPAAVEIGGVVDSQHGFSIPAGQSRVFPLRSSGPLSTVWGFQFADRPLSASMVFTTNQTGSATATTLEPQEQGADEFVGEAGIAASGVSTRHVLNVVKTASGVGTAFAIANPTTATASLVLELLDTANNQVAEKELELGPRTQTARFFDIFFELAAESFSGTVGVFSDTDVSVVSLRTLNGVQTSSLASGSRGGD